MILNQMKGLILKYLRGEISAAERRELDAWLAQSPDNQLLFEEITDPEWVAIALSKMDALHEEEIWNRIRDRTAYGQPEGQAETLFTPARRKIGRYWVAAAIIVLFGLGGYLWQGWRPAKMATVAKQPVVQDVAPGTTKAVLTLSDGTKIVLDSAKSGQLAVQGKTTVANNNGAITYRGKTTPELMYNTLTTNRGEQSPPLTLSDGSKVWLNAASSIRFPVAFAGNTRTVEITGEAYFEVAQNAKMPFTVKKGNTEVAVLGTSFNINSYDDETALKVTLVDGAVKISHDQFSAILTPGEQARVGNNVEVAKEVDLEVVLAWKNGYFQFKRDNLQQVLRQLVRWYDIDVRYEGSIPDMQFGGRISRNNNLSEVLKILELSNVHFKIEGKTLVVIA